MGDGVGVVEPDVEVPASSGYAQGADDDDVVAGEVADAGVQVVLDGGGLVGGDHDGRGGARAGAGSWPDVEEDAAGRVVGLLVGGGSVVAGAQSGVGGGEGVDPSYEAAGGAGGAVGQFDEGPGVEAVVEEAGVIVRTFAGTVEEFLEKSLEKKGDMCFLLLKRGWEWGRPPPGGTR